MKAFVASILILAAGTVGACASCSTTAGPDASTDAAQDARKSDAGDGGGAVCDASFWDGGVISDWPGFRRLTEFSPCCVFDVAMDLTAVPQMTWGPCENGVSTCKEWVRSWSVNNPPGYFGSPKVSRHADGTPALLQMGFGISGLVSAFGVYDLATSKVVAGSRINAATACFPGTVPAGDGMAFFGCVAPNAACYGAGGAATSVLGAPSLRSLVPAKPIPGLQSTAASGSRFAFDVQPYGWIEQWSLDGGALVQSTNTTSAALLLDFVEGDDVYAWSEHGTSGWSEEYRVATDGTVVPYRSKPNTHVTAMASDGSNVTWCESYGNSASSPQQPNVEVWTAPYTNDAATLAGTAKKLATLPFAATCGSATSFSGYYAVTTVPFFMTEVIRLSDGAMQSVSAGPGWGFGTFALVSATELWSTMNEETDAGTLGAGGIAFARYTLGAWP